VVDATDENYKYISIFFKNVKKNILILVEEKIII
jgi:hypothetical protein